MCPFFSTPRKVEVYRIGLPALILAPVMALVLQTYLPLYLPSVTILDLPLLVVLYYALTWRSPVAALLGGALIGMAQDSLAKGPIGLLGTIKTVIGFVTSSVSTQLEMESTGIRFATIFFFYWLHFILFYLLGSPLLRFPVEWDWTGRLSAALVNALVGVLIFRLLDIFRKPA